LIWTITCANNVFWKLITTVSEREFLEKKGHMKEYYVVVEVVLIDNIVPCFPLEMAH
jgi:hypothetical protein